MSDGDPELTELVGELARAVDELQSELAESRGPPRPPTPQRLARFTSEVTIPAVILLLETNVRALRLLQRTLRIADGRDPAAGSSARDRAASLGQQTLTRLDDALSDVQDAVAEDPSDDVDDLLQQVRDLQAEVDARLDATETASDADSQTVDVDVEEELRTLKDDVDIGSDEGNNSNE